MQLCGSRRAGERDFINALQAAMEHERAAFRDAMARQNAEFDAAIARQQAQFDAIIETKRAKLEQRYAAFKCESLKTTCRQ